MVLIKPIRDNDDFKGAFRNVKNGPNRAKKVKRVAFKGVVVLTHFFMVMRETQCVLYSSHVRVPLNLMKPIRDNEDHINLRKMHQDFCFSLKITLLAVIGHFGYS